MGASRQRDVPWRSLLLVELILQLKDNRGMCSREEIRHLSISFITAAVYLFRMTPPPRSVLLKGACVQRLACVTSLVLMC